MATDHSNDATRSVRVEIGDSTPGAPLPDGPKAEGASPNPKVALVVIALGVVLIGALLYSLAPEERAAVDEESEVSEVARPPVSTVPVVSTTGTIVSPVAVDDGPRTFAGFESVSNIFPFWQIARIGEEWVAIAPPGTNRGIAHSSDGLHWDVVGAEFGAQATVVGVGVWDGAFVVATVLNPSPDRITLFESTDGRRWAPSARYGELPSQDVREVSIAGESVAVMRVSDVADPTYDLLQQFLSPVVEPGIAQLVCSATFRAESILNLRNCDGDIIQSIEREAAPLLFSLDLNSCVSQLRSIADFEHRVDIYTASGDLVNATVSPVPLGFRGWFDGITFLGFGSSFVFEQCRSEGLPGEPAVVYRSDASGSGLIELPRSVGFQNVGPSLVPIARAADGDAVLLSRADSQFNAVLLRSRAPHSEWTELALPDDSGFAWRSITPDASLVMASDQGTWSFFDIERREIVREIDVAQAGEAPVDGFLLLATNNYAIVRVGGELVRVPLGGGER